MKREQLDPLMVLIEELNALRANSPEGDYCDGITDAISLARSAMHSMHNRWDADNISVKDQWRIVLMSGGSSEPFDSLSEVNTIASTFSSKIKIQTRITATVQSDWVDDK